MLCLFCCHVGSNVSSEGVQRDLLPILEGSTVATKYGNVSTDHVLFIASGAFHSSKPGDMLAELQVRCSRQGSSSSVVLPLDHHPGADRLCVSPGVCYAAGA
jgi:hypothetical protein